MVRSLCLAGALALVTSAAKAQIVPEPLPMPGTPLPTAPLPLSPTPTAPQPVIITEPVSQPTNLEPIPATEFQLNLPGAAPTGIQASATSARSVRVAWTAPPDAQGYQLYRQWGRDTVFYPVGNQVTGVSTDDGGLLPGTDYRYKVAAYYPSTMRRRPGMSTATGTRTPPPPAPSGLTAQLAGHYRVSLAWQPLTEANGYRLYRDGKVLIELRPIQIDPTRSMLPSTWADSVPAGPHQYQLQAVFRLDTTEVTSGVVPSPAVGVAVPAWFCLGGMP